MELAVLRPPKDGTKPRMYWVRDGKLSVELINLKLFSHWLSASNPRIAHSTHLASGLEFGYWADSQNDH